MKALNTILSAVVLLGAAGAVTAAAGAQPASRAAQSAASAAPVETTETRWRSLYEQAVRNYQAKAYEQAESAGRQALELARSGQGETAPFEVASLNLLGMVRQSQGRGAEAVALLEQALRVSEASLGAHLNTASLAFNLGGVLDEQGEPAQARSYYQRTLELVDALPGEAGAEALRGQAHAALTAQESRKRAQALTQAAQWNEQALAHLDREEYEAAQALWGQALAMVEAERGPDSIEAARLVANQAQGLERQGDAKGAQPLHQRALDIYEKFGGDPEALLGQARALNYQAAYVYRQRRFAQAEPLFVKALGLMERAVGADDARVLPVLENLHALYRSTGRADDAAKIARRIEPLKAAAKEK